MLSLIFAIRYLTNLFRYEGRCGLPTNFDATYCYALGYAAGALLHVGKTGLISSVSNSASSVFEVDILAQVCFNVVLLILCDKWSMVVIL